MLYVLCRQDLSYVTRWSTTTGLQPNAVNRLLFKIEGPGIIAGVANADMKDTDSYVGNTHKPGTDVLWL